MGINQPSLTTQENRKTVDQWNIGVVLGLCGRHTGKAPVMVKAVYASIEKL